MIIGFNRHALLRFGRGRYGLHPSIPHLTPLSLHRDFDRHGISRLPALGGQEPKRSEVAGETIGWFHIGIA